jgi:hypothetical protein
VSSLLAQGGRRVRFFLFALEGLTTALITEKMLTVNDLSAILLGFLKNIAYLCRSLME